MFSEVFCFSIVSEKKSGPSFKVHTLATFQKMNVFTVFVIQNNDKQLDGGYLFYR